MRARSRARNRAGRSHGVGVTVNVEVAVAGAGVSVGDGGTAEDFTGTPLMNNAMECVIGLNLQFYQLQYPSVTIGPGKHYNYYQLQTRVTPRAP